MHKNGLKVPKNATGAAKNGLAGLKSVHGWTKMGTPGATFAHFALLATWCIPLRIFVHFYEVFVNSGARFLKIHGNTRTRFSLF